MKKIGPISVYSVFFALISVVSLAVLAMKLSYFNVIDAESFIIVLYFDSLLFGISQFMWLTLFLKMNEMHFENKRNAIMCIFFTFVGMQMLTLPVFLFNIPFSIAGKIFSLIYICATLATMIATCHLSGEKKTSLRSLFS